MTYPGAAKGSAGELINDLEAKLSFYGYNVGGYSVVLQDELGKFLGTIEDPEFKGIVDLSSLANGENALSELGIQAISRLTAWHELGHAVERVLGFID